MSPSLAPGRTTSSRRLAATMGLLLVATAGCQIPNFKGPQIQEPPPGFYRVPDAGQSWRMFPERESVHYDVWVNAAWGDVSTIHINGYPGRMMRAEVQDALDGAMALMDDSVTFSGLQQFAIDGETAWGWAEQMRTPTRGLVWIGLRVAIPYDTITYTLEIISGDPALKREPDTLIAIASTFGVGKTEWNVPLIAAIVLAVVVLSSVLRKRAQEKAARMREIRFVKVDKPEDQEAGAAAGGGEAGASPAPRTPQGPTRG